MKAFAGGGHSLEKAADPHFTREEIKSLTKAAVICAVWPSTFLLLLAVGGLLSWATLRVAGRVPTQPNGRAQGGDAFLRRLYRGVLWLSCAFYWVSIPLVALTVLAAGGGLIYFFFWIGHIPIKLVLLLAAGVFMTLAAIARSLFVRGEDGDPGLLLELATEPRCAPCSTRSRRGSAPGRWTTST